MGRTLETTASLCLAEIKTVKLNRPVISLNQMTLLSLG